MTCGKHDCIHCFPGTKNSLALALEPGTKSPAAYKCSAREVRAVRRVFRLHFETHSSESTEQFLQFFDGNNLDFLVQDGRTSLLMGPVVIFVLAWSGSGRNFSSLKSLS